MRSKLLMALSVLALVLPVSCTFNSTSEIPEPASTPDPTTVPAQSTTPSVEPSKTSSSHLVISDKVRLGAMDNEALITDYPITEHMSCTELRQIPMENYGWYYSDTFFLEQESTILISIESDCPVGSDAEGYQFSGGIWMEVDYVFEQETCDKGSAGTFESADVHEFSSGDWETNYIYRTSKTGFYMIELINDSGESMSCEYRITIN